MRQDFRQRKSITLLASVALGLSCAGRVDNDASSTDAVGSSGGSSTTATASTNPVDPSILSRGDNNAVSTGGYWYTYTDHNGADSQFHATLKPKTSQSVPLQPVVDNDPSHGNVLRIMGRVPAQLPWQLVAQQDSSTFDSYWQAIYPDSRIPAYPAAGIGLGFSLSNAPFDATGGGKWIGVAFDLKVTVDTPVVWVSMPMVGTDLPDPQYNDAFPLKCQYYTAANSPDSGGSNCFAYHRRGIFSASSTAGLSAQYNTLGAVGVWKRFCVLYADVTVPNWANTTTINMMPAFDPTQMLKVSWDMYQPYTGGEAANFEVSLDNVELITEAQAGASTNNCDPSMIGQPPGSGSAG